MGNSLKESVYQFLKFCLVGIIGAIINYSIFFILYRFLGIYYLISSGTGFVISVAFAFSLNSRFTFNMKRENYKLKLKGYFLVNLFTLFLGLMFLKLFVDGFSWNIYLSNILIIGIQVISNFTGSKFLVFKN